jgi:hypothetical protein
MGDSQSQCQRQPSAARPILYPGFDVLTGRTQDEIYRLAVRGLRHAGDEEPHDRTVIHDPMEAFNDIYGPNVGSFNARVKIWSVEGHRVVNGGHEMFMIPVNTTFRNLSPYLKRKFREVMDGNGFRQSNLDARCYWSDDHILVSIKALWNPNADEVWGVSHGDTNMDMTSLNDYNMAQNLAVLKTQPVPTLSVVIQERSASVASSNP